MESCLSSWRKRAIKRGYPHAIQYEPAELEHYSETLQKQVNEQQSHLKKLNECEFTQIRSKSNTLTCHDHGHRLIQLLGPVVIRSIFSCFFLQKLVLFFY